MTMTEEAPVAVSDPAEPADSGKKGKKAKKEKAPKGRSNLLPALVLAAGVAAGGYFMGGGSSSAANATPTTVAPELGEMVRLEPMTLNLDGGRFLRVGVAFRMTVDYEVTADSDGAITFPAEDEGRLRDQLIAMFSGRDGSTLVTSEQLEETKAELLERANVLFGGQAVEVYLTDFVMQ